MRPILEWLLDARTKCPSSWASDCAARRRPSGQARRQQVARSRPGAVRARRRAKRHRPRSGLGDLARRLRRFTPSRVCGRHTRRRDPGRPRKQEWNDVRRRARDESRHAARCGSDSNRRCCAGISRVIRHGIHENAADPGAEEQIVRGDYFSSRSFAATRRSVVGSLQA